MAIEIPVSWIGPVILTITPAIPPIMLIIGILMIWIAEDPIGDPMGALFGVWVATIGALGCIAEVFLFGWARFV